MCVNYRLILEVLTITRKTVQITLHVGLSYTIVSLPQSFLKPDSTFQCMHFYFMCDGAGHKACVGERRGTHKVLVGKPKPNRPLKTKVEMGERENLFS
jgi:hypothetical protein